MKNVLVIDSADNCAYDVFAVTEGEFATIFPGQGQDIAFIDEVFAATASEAVLIELMEGVWNRPVAKPAVQGIDGTLFYQLEFKKQFYPNRRDSDLDGARGRGARRI